MKREIKFRGRNQENQDWVYGDLITMTGNRFNIWPDNTGSISVYPDSVGQFTGLHDKNGKEIYEGDIIFNSNKTLITLPEDPRTYLVEWKEGKYNDENNWLSINPGFYFTKIKYNHITYMSLIFNQSQIEVIGNIFENPELLTKP